MVRHGSTLRHGSTGSPTAQCRQAHRSVQASSPTAHQQTSKFGCPNLPSLMLDFIEFSFLRNVHKITSTTSEKPPLTLGCAV